jgi:NTP pyrophosphatase (non-canonical NTP hydrolase)
MHTAPSSQLTLTQYQEQSTYTDQFASDSEAINHLRYGFFGEVGGLLAAVKKAHRETISQSECAAAREEIGDALWYLAALARRAELNFDQIGDAAIAVLQRHLHVAETKRSGKSVSFREIDGLLAFQGKQIPEPTGKLLYALAAHTGSLFAAFDEAAGQIATPRVIDQFADLLASLGMVAASFGLSLADVAQTNLHKITFRWRRKDAPYLEFFDSGYPAHEQLPRQLEIEFIERDVRGKKLVVQRLRGVNIGDPLTDNRIEADDYRFHDVFHLAYVAHLGWSPVIRGLLKIKRKSHPDVDENEDGARAMIIEEGIATWIFNHARDKGEFFAKVAEGKLEYGLLKQVQAMVSGYEVDRCPLWQWEKAILDGFQVFRQLREKRGGIVTVKMQDHSITYSSLKGSAL